MFDNHQFPGITFSIGCVDGLICLDEDVTRLEGDHDHFLQQSIWELSLEVHILLQAGILLKCIRWDLTPVQGEYISF